MIARFAVLLSWSLTNTMETCRRLGSAARFEGHHRREQQVVARTDAGHMPEPIGACCPNSLPSGTTRSIPTHRCPSH
ncbi:hypothetical protein QBC34DRAFT_400912 [Podospora aff. communis PSN243]|uniref:Secreted protein n=1 Tax=Podospora aff. communis PSN243 TaxID=3040156 RepID=A0AAV9GVJ9_9PEZI|nr:hypothetical protein QBC34DRAFT_400912 [Podospora aff. communis PSN243]